MYFVANWKMNPPSLAEAERLLKQIRDQLRSVKEKEGREIIICPPAIFFPKIAKKNSNLKFGIQNIGWEERGSYTGEISVLMAKDFGAEYCLVNHSERKLYFGEDSSLANKKIKLCLEKGITPIYCIGETLEEKENGKTRAILEKQITEGLRGLNLIRAREVIITYEPIWTISTQAGGEAENPDNVLAINILIRKILFDMYDPKTARGAKILYGGSINKKNISDYLKNKCSDGFLIGSASLNPSDFISIIRKTEKINQQNVS
jgi:triosephosphate isomerase (TIM)